MKNLAEKNFWKKYWTNKPNIVKKIRKRHFFDILFKREIKNNSGTLLEIGGFPGHYSIYFKKYYQLNPTLIDYYIDKKIISELLKVNNLSKTDLEIIQSNVFKHKLIKKYDYVVSFGFLEHFKNIKKVINSHTRYAKKNGKIIIAIPNFLGVNGWIQKNFDPDTYKTHNLESMKIKKLETILNSIDIESYKIKYYGGFLIWLEEIHKRSKNTQAFFLIANLFGHVLKYLNINSKLLSPYILIIINK